ncbi:MAG: helix-turn-helix domain-containing protein, partial [Rhodococcus sp. (in: high G+C Gram-positive bacteria)]
MATAPRSTRSQAVRAEIVLACAESSVAEVARRTGVDPHTAMKWKRRFQADGVAGLADGRRSGRPALDAEVAHTVLTRPLLEAPSGRWTTRSIADAAGLSQTTVSRIRRTAFPRSPDGDSPIVADQSALLAFVYVGPDRRILGLHSPAAAGMAYRPRRSSSAAAVTAPLETVLCASLVAGIAAQRLVPDEATTALFRRAIEGAPTDRTMTLLLDFTPDPAAERWLARHPRVDAVVVSPQRWLAQLHILAGTVDSRQLPQLLDVQQ